MIDEKKLDWGKAKEYLENVRKIYSDIGVSGLLALQITINPLLIRLEKGEKSQDLYDSIMALE